MAEITVDFPKNLQVRAKLGTFELLTDQPSKSGGDGEAPSPFDLFTASMATCMGYFALKFCQSRSIDTAEMRLTMQYEWNSEAKRYPKMSITLHPPPHFPEKYHGAIIKAMDQCAVKKHILQPPEFELSVAS
jgi:uncharacterized OsmC-like protein